MHENPVKSHSPSEIDNFEDAQERLSNMGLGNEFTSMKDFIFNNTIARIEAELERDDEYGETWTKKYSLVQNPLGSSDEDKEQDHNQETLKPPESHQTKPDEESYDETQNPTGKQAVLESPRTPDTRGQGKTV